MPYASRRDPDDLEGLAAALDALVGTEYEEQVFVWVDGTPEGHSLDVVHSRDDIDGEELATTPDLVLPTGVPPEPVEDASDDDADEDEDDWDDEGADEGVGRYLVYVGYVPGVPFAERGVPVPTGTLLLEDDGSGATVALPHLPTAAVVELLGAWARGVLGGASIGGLWWATTFEGDDDAGDVDDAEGPARNGDART